MTTRGIVMLTACCFLHAAPAVTQSHARDSVAVAATVASFHAGLARGDSSAVLALLAPDAIVLESGDQETVAEYRAHHLASDIAFVQAIPSVRTPTAITIVGDVAWAAATSTTEGTFRGRAVRSAGVELMVLSRTGTGWTIRAIHWSSRTLRTTGG